MSLNVSDIVGWKEEKNQFGIDSYTWFFTELEDNSISKLNGAARNASMINRYEFEKEAVDYILNQLFIVNEDAAKELMGELDIKEAFISDENRKYLEYNWS